MMSANISRNTQAERRQVTRPADIPLLVVSFDGYEDLWAPFFSFFWSRWPDCPFPVFLVTNFKDFGDARVKSIRTGPEVSWATRLRRALESANTDYVLLVLDDFLIHEPVDTPEVLRLAGIALQEQVGCLRLAPKPAPSEPVPGYEDLGRILPDDPYRATSQVAFWHVDTLLALLREDYSIWDFEFQSSLHGPIPERPLWARWRPAITYRDCLSRGKWMPWGVALCRKAGVPIDLETRPRIRGRMLFQHYYGRARGFVFRRLPRSMQRRRWQRIVARSLQAGRG